MRFAPEGRPFIVGSAALMALCLAAATLFGDWAWFAVALSVVVSAFMLFFFRDPVRPAPEDPTAVLAPAEGRIVQIAEVEEPEFMAAPCRRISIFLSIFDVHVQRAPVGGVVAHRRHKGGGFAAAWAARASHENEQTSLGLRTETGPVLVRQIAGLVARRIVTDPEVGDAVARGERIGLIRFGSRVDLFLPSDWPLLCRNGDRARVGLTVLARRPASASGAGERP